MTLAEDLKAYTAIVLLSIMATLHVFFYQVNTWQKIYQYVRNKLKESKHKH